MRATLATCALLLAAATQLHAAPLPTTGMTMNAVEQALGAPREKTGPVGRPPITRWVYDGVVVVFEHNKVVQSVQITGGAPMARPEPAPAPAPKPSAPAPATQAPKPAPAVPSDAQIRNNEAIRRAAEQEADEKARAATEAARKAAEAAEAAQAKAKAAATIEAEKAVETPPAANTPASTPATAPATSPASTGTEAKDPSYSFDPATGRIIIN